MSILRRDRKQGIALVMVLLAVLVLATLAGGLVLVTSNHMMISGSGTDSQQALYAAKAGAWIKLGQAKMGNLDPLKETVMPDTSATFVARVEVGDGIKAFPPKGTYYVEAVGTSASGATRRVGMLAAVSESRWNHAAFGNNFVEMKSGSYTDAFNSDTGEPADHSKASIATNNAVDGIRLDKNNSVVVGWSGGFDPVTKKHKKKKPKKKDLLKPEADVQGPPGSAEKAVVKGDDDSYSAFTTANQVGNTAPVVMPAVPTEVAPPADLTTIQGAVNDPLVSALPSVVTSGVTPSILPPGAYHQLQVGKGGVAVLDVSAETPGSEVSYVFHGIHLNGGILTVKQPATGGSVTVKVYMDTGDGTDKTAGVHMSGASLVNPSAKPIDLQFLIAGQGTNTLEGHDELKDGLGPPTAYYVAYAPQATIEITKGQIFGAVVADQVKLDGDSLLDPDKASAVIHYDVALLNDTGNPPVLKILSTRHY